MRSILVLLDTRSELLFPQFLRPVFVSAFLLREVVEQLANARNGGSQIDV
jgi:hypothetical protein